MSTNRFSRHFYSTPYYTPTEQPPSIFAVKSLHVLPRHFHSRARAIGARHRDHVLRTARIADTGSPDS